MLRHTRTPTRTRYKITRFLRNNLKFIIFFTFCSIVLLSFHIFTVNARPLITPEEHEWLRVTLPLQIVTSKQEDEDADGPIVISNPIGGIGNQMFQYACAYSVARSLGAERHLWIRAPLTPGNLSLGLSPEQRRFALTNFNIKIRRATEEETSLLESKIRKYGMEEPEERELLDYIHGIKKLSPSAKIINTRLYCESEAYFEPYREELIQSFQINDEVLKFIQKTRPSVQQLLSDLENKNDDFESVGVHVRRGDFNTVGGGYYRLLPDSYYMRAIDLIKMRLNLPPKFYVFTDDLEYAKGVFGDSSDFVYVSGLMTKTSLEDFLLLRKCKHLILANSSFSWWSAYLNKNEGKTVVAPFPRYKWWYAYAKYEVFKKYYLIPTFYPAEWVTLNPWE